MVKYIGSIVGTTIKENFDVRRPLNKPQKIGINKWF